MNSASTVEAQDSVVGRWQDYVVREVFRMMHHIEEDNFDAIRYQAVPPNAFVPDFHAEYFSFFLRHVADFFGARTLLEDEASRALFDRLVLFRMLGHLHVRLPFNNEETKGHGAIVDRWRVGETDDIGMIGPLGIFEVPQRNTSPIRLKCWRENVMWTFLTGQYYYRRDGVEIAPMAGDQIIDAGGCFGDTAVAFAVAAGPSGHVHTFDPIPKHCAIIRENLDMNPGLAPRITVHEYGLSNARRVGNGVGPAIDAINPGATAFDESLSTMTLDDLVDDGSVQRVDFIKMDIEGSELDALRGAERVLRRDQPRLAISLYHRPEDFFAIPLFIHGLGIGYRFYLDHYSIHREETVLYAQV
ncbi:MAG: FkbM family methyltransferase [Burkholderiales bacterium]|nr:FkbM family methyltransferase [Burkholderiales bacterium]